LLHLLEEICSHVLIVKRGEKAAYGTLSQIQSEFGNEAGDASLEQIFIRLVGEDAGK
jgi:ABC-2 type transport system ATP-binding protein